MLRDKVTNILIIGDISICVNVCSEAYTFTKSPETSNVYYCATGETARFQSTVLEKKAASRGFRYASRTRFSGYFRVMLGQLGQQQKDLSSPAGCSIYPQKLHVRPLHCVDLKTAAS
jgi:hypothetical protein